MKRLLALLAMATMIFAGSAQARPVSDEDAYAIGVEAYVYAYPMVLMEVTRRVSTNAGMDGRTRAPVNHFANMRAYPAAGFTGVVRPNADTLYSTLWFDLGKEPLIITWPATDGRYHVVPIMDMWTDVFAMVGSRTTGDDGGSVALVGPDWTDELPAGLRMIRSPTEQGWIVGRIQTNGPADYAHVHALQAGFAATPLSQWGKPQAAASGPESDPAIDMSPPVDQVARMDPTSFFALFAEMMKRNPPHATDHAIIERMERIGLVPGRSFDLASAEPQIRVALTRAAGDGLQRILDHRRTVALTRTNWTNLGSVVGVYGNAYLQRAMVSFTGLGALPPEEAIYPMARFDAQGQPLNGANRYVLHFDKAQIPPARAFWSLTMYGEDQFFAANSIGRYAIGDRDPLSFNPDGSLDLYIQNESPGPARQSNWLPAPAGPFTMNLRLYWPQDDAVDGRWVAPAVERVQ